MWSDQVASVRKIEQGTVPMREKKRRKSKEKMGRQHQRVDRSRICQQQSESSRGPSEMAEDCHRCQQWCPYNPGGSGTQVILLITDYRYRAHVSTLNHYTTRTLNGPVGLNTNPTLIEVFSDPTIIAWMLSV